MTIHIDFPGSPRKNFDYHPLSPPITLPLNDAIDFLNSELGKGHRDATVSLDAGSYPGSYIFKTPCLLKRTDRNEPFPGPEGSVLIGTPSAKILSFGSSPPPGSSIQPGGSIVFNWEIANYRMDYGIGVLIKRPSGILDVNLIRDAKGPSEHTYSDIGQYVFTLYVPGGETRSISLSVVPPPTTVHETTYSFYLPLVHPFSGPDYYTGFVGESIHGNLISITNPNLFVVAILKAGHSTDEIASPGVAVVLATGATTTPEDVKAIYGTSNPTLPARIIAGLQAGSPEFPNLRLDVHYSYSQ